MLRPSPPRSDLVRGTRRRVFRGKDRGSGAPNWHTTWRRLLGARGVTKGRLCYKEGCGRQENGTKLAFGSSSAGLPPAPFTTWRNWRISLRLGPWHGCSGRMCSGCGKMIACCRMRDIPWLQCSMSILISRACSGCLGGRCGDGSCSSRDFREFRCPAPSWPRARCLRRPGGGGERGLSSS